MVAAYRKLVVAVVGVGALLANRHLGMDFFGHEAAIVEVLIGALTALGVWRFPNEPLPENPES